MATRIPLVIVDGKIEQLQAGDSINVPASQYSQDVFTNAESSAAIVAGMAVYLTAANAAKRAQANAAATALVAALWQDASTSAGNTGNVITDGRVSLTTAQWDAVAGTSGGLTFGTVYYLDPTSPGKLTSTAPTTVGQLVVQVGIAVSTTDMDLILSQPILL
jgi:hypothetical protein